jgi:hypothetical protein
MGNSKSYIQISSNLDTWKFEGQTWIWNWVGIGNRKKTKKKQNCACVGQHLLFPTQPSLGQVGQTHPSPLCCRSGHCAEPRCASTPSLMCGPHPPAHLKANLFLRLVGPHGQSSSSSTATSAETKLHKIWAKIATNLGAGGFVGVGIGV